MFRVVRTDLGKPVTLTIQVLKLKHYDARSLSKRMSKSACSKLTLVFYANLRSSLFYRLKLLNIK